MKKHHSRAERWSESPQAGGGSSPPPSEHILDAAIECTFPASDPIAVQHAFETACARERASAEAP
jgi:hypothetical protein